MSFRVTWSGFFLVGLALAGCGEVSTTFVDAAGSGIDAPAVCSPACDVNATCTGATCACDAGYMGDGVTCTDINECATTNGGCDPNALCTNTAGSRPCASLLGLVGNGMSCQRAWSLVATFAGVPIDPDRFGAVAVGVGNRLYFANETNTAANEVFRYFDTTTNALSGPLAAPPDNDFAAAGFGEIFVSDGASIFMFGNYGQRYDTAAGTWSSVSTYTQARSRGESAGVYHPTTGKIIMAGGRTFTINMATDTATAFTIATGAFDPEPGTMPFAISNAMAWALPGSTSIYVAGGRSPDNGSHLMRHAIGSTTWEALPDSPMDVRSPTGIGHFGNRLWVANDSVLMFFNPATTTWDRTIGAPANMKVAAFANGSTWALAAGAGGLEFYRLNAIE